VALTLPAAGQQTASAASAGSTTTQQGQTTAQTPPATTTPAQTPDSPAAAPSPLAMPSMSGPLETAAPAHVFDGGPFGQVDVTGVISGMVLTQGNWFAGDKATQWDLSNGQIFVQKTSGWWQFYLQAGAYNLPDLGVPFLSTGHTTNDFYGPFPQGYLKLVKGNFSVEVGALPTLIGAEYTFDFENMNIERGIVWNQENAVNRGVQINDSIGKLSASFSWNDGFYSNRYSWLWGSLSYAINSSNTLAFIGGGNLSQTSYTSLATPIQNNSQIYNIIYTYSHESWVIQPYWQFTNVPTNTQIGIAKGATTNGGALLLTYNFPHGISMAARGEYLTSSGSPTDGAVNLMYGPGSGAWSFTVTPTYHDGDFFIRGEFSVVRALRITPGDAFGTAGLNDTQPRGLVEAGFLF
jgi:hypothetical protein